MGQLFYNIFVAVGTPAASWCSNKNQTCVLVESGGCIITTLCTCATICKIISDITISKCLRFPKGGT